MKGLNSYEYKLLDKKLPHEAFYFLHLFKVCLRFIVYSCHSERSKLWQSK